MGVQDILRRRREVVGERIEIGRRSSIERKHHGAEVMMPWWV